MATTKTTKTTKTAAKKAPAKKAPAKKAPAKAAAVPAKKAPAKKAAAAGGASAPAFSLPSDEGKTVSLSDFKGKRVVLYFYPKDNTPGCTRESCAFQDNLATIAKRGAVVLGVSRDSVKSHAGFKAKYGFGFPLLADTDAAVHRAYGAWGTKSMYGKTIEGALRTTVIIDENGAIAKRFDGVKVDGHVDAVVAALDALG